MTSRGRVIINCCGPYRFFGEPVIKACIESGSHYLDVSGEPEVSKIIFYNCIRTLERLSSGILNYFVDYVIF